jgi:hypothetical protein
MELATMQFSLKTLMIAMLIVAVLCGILFSFPRPLTSLMVFFAASMLPALLVTMIVYGDGGKRVFAIGAATTYVALLMGLPPRPSGFPRFGRFLGSPGEFLFLLFLLVVAGLFSVGFQRWLLGRSTRLRHPDSAPVMPPDSTNRPVPGGAPRPGHDAHTAPNRPL